MTNEYNFQTMIPAAREVIDRLRNDIGPMFTGVEQSLAAIIVHNGRTKAVSVMLYSDEGTPNENVERVAKCLLTYFATAGWTIFGETVYSSSTAEFVVFPASTHPDLADEQKDAVVTAKDVITLKAKAETAALNYRHAYETFAFQSNDSFVPAEGDLYVQLPSRLTMDDLSAFIMFVSSTTPGSEVVAFSPETQRAYLRPVTS
jgi:hypothetical protein